MKKFNEGDRIYFVSSSIFVREATVIRCAGGFVTIKFDTNNGNEGPSGIRIRDTKVYSTEKEANEVAKRNRILHEKIRNT